MRKSITYYFSLISPFTYLGQPRIIALGNRTDVNLIYKPFNIAKVFEETGNPPISKRHPSLQAYRLLEMERLSKAFNLPLNLHPQYFPSPSDQAGAMVMVAQVQGIDVGPLVMGLLEGVWADEKNIANEQDLINIANKIGLDGTALVKEAASEEALSTITDNTEDALSSGVFGSPSLVIDGEIFWGQDRIEMASIRLGELPHESN